MQPRRDPLTVGLIVVSVLALIAIAIAGALSGGDDRPTPPPGSQTTKVDNADGDAKADDTVTLDPAAVKVKDGFKQDPKDLRPKGLRGRDRGPVARLQPPFAADEVAGCRTRFLTTNWSYRNVAPNRVQLFWLHFTGGPDKPGTRSEVDGLTAYGNNPAARVSWHFNMDKDGNCDYNVPLRYKAWTEGNANPTGVSIEVAGTGSGDYLRPGGVAQLRRILAETRAAYPGIKLQLGGVSNCTPTKGGLATHWMGGPCSGGHTDIRPHEIQKVIALLAPPPAVTAHARKLCQELNRGRKKIKAHEPVDRVRLAKVRKALEKKYVCRYGPPGSIVRR